MIPRVRGVNAATIVSAVSRKNVFACQFHPERSGERGLLVYRNVLQDLSRELAKELPQ